MNSLELYLAIVKNLYPKQGTQQWMENRIKSIGCSELYDASRPIKNVRSINAKRNFLKKKFAFESIDHLDSVILGKLFEPTNKKFTEFLFDCKIHESPGSILGDNGISCSPDGLGYVDINLKYFHKFFTTMHEKDNYLIIRKNKSYSHLPEILDYSDFNNGNKKFKTLVLFEFKCLTTRKMEKTIPLKYLYQVLGGMDVIKIANFCIYNECKFRFCNIQDLGFNNRYNNFKVSREIISNTEFTNEPFMIGFKIICSDNYNENPLDITENLYEFKFVTENEKFISFDSPIVYKQFGKIKFCEGKFVQKLNKLNINTEKIEDIILEIKNSLHDNLRITILYNQLYNIIKSQQKGIIFIFCWKLFDFKAFIVPRIHGFISSLSNEIDPLVNFINENNNKNIDEIYDNINNFSY